MNNFYEEHHKHYFRQTVALDPQNFLNPLIKHLAPKSSILDIGCGSGRDLLWLKDHGHEPTGLEQSSGLAKLAQSHSGCPVIKRDFTSFDFSSLHFDALMFIGALVHLDHADLATVLSHVSRALEPSGIICLTLKEGDGYHFSEDGRRFSLWQSEQLEDIFQKNGFPIINFSRDISVLNAEDIWLSYLLRRDGDL